MNSNIQRISTFLLLLLALCVSASWASAQSSCEQNLIVGAWHGLSGEGNHIIVSFTSSRNVIGSVQTEVSLNGRLGVLTPTHGAWTCSGNGEFTFTSIGLLYSASNGGYRGYIKARGLVTIDPNTPNVLTGNDRVTIYGPNDEVVFEVPPAPITWTRVAVQPFN